MHRVGRNLCNFNRLYVPYPIPVCHVKGFTKSSQSLQQDVVRFPSVSSHGNAETPTESARRIGQCLFVNPVDSTGEAVNSSPSNGRVMLIDGTAVIYRAYYKLLAKLHHGYLSHADGNGDWVMTIFTALSLIIDVLEFVPSHVAELHLVNLLFHQKKL